MILSLKPDVHPRAPCGTRGYRLAVLVVWKLDRLSRSLRDVLTIMERLSEAEAGFHSLTEAIDTTTPAGRMMMQDGRVFR